jgi:hypothetical protein
MVDGNKISKVSHIVGLVVGLILAASSIYGLWTRNQFALHNDADVVVTLQWARRFFLDRRVLALGVFLGVLLSVAASASLVFAYK